MSRIFLGQGGQSAGIPGTHRWLGTSQIRAVHVMYVFKKNIYNFSTQIGLRDRLQAIKQVN